MSRMRVFAIPCDLFLRSSNRNQRRSRWPNRLGRIRKHLHLQRHQHMAQSSNKMDINNLHQTRYQILETAYTLQQQAASLQQQISDNAALQRNLAGQLQEVTAQINQAMQPAPVEPAPAPEPGSRQERLGGNV